jgi:hypothetical protein
VREKSGLKAAAARLWEEAEAHRDRARRLQVWFS